MEISNKTKRPVRVPLPGGKKLHLGPGKTGQISPKASEHPALVKLIDEGVIEILDGGRARSSGSSGGTSGMNTSQRGTGGTGMRHTGDR